MGALLVLGLLMFVGVARHVDLAGSPLSTSLVAVIRNGYM